MDKKVVTRADIAKRAGVSQTIVSYVINNNRYVEKSKRERVEKAIQELQYRPNNIARALQGKRTNHLLFIADEIETEHFGQLMVEMDKYAYHYGYMVSLCTNRNSEEFISQVISRFFDGIVISSTIIPEAHIKRLVTAGIPVVLLKNRMFYDVGKVGFIDTGLYNGAKNSVEHLVERQREQLIYVDTYNEFGKKCDMDDLRMKGFVEQLNVHNLTYDETHIFTGFRNPEEVKESIVEAIRSGRIIDGVIARNDRIARLVIDALESEGYRVPKDVSVIGFDNSSISKYAEPKLTSVNIRRDLIGKEIIEMLHSMIDGKTSEDKHIDTELIIRASS